MKLSFHIDGRLPSLNEIISANRQNRFKGAELKRKYQKPLELLFKAQAKGKKIENHADVRVWFYEPYDGKHRRDDDNVIAGMKFILDALVNVGILKDDNPKYVHAVGERFTDCKACHIDIEVNEK